MEDQDKQRTEELVAQANGDMMPPAEVFGFEETKAEDIVIPRIKVIQGLSPEVEEKTANIGDIVNSLTKEILNGKKFIPIKQTYSNICWNPDRKAEQRIICRSADGKIGQGPDGARACATCGKNKFDNTKVGKDAQPQCTSYLNYVGFMEDVLAPIVLSFARTNYNEGRKMLSLAKSTMQSIWNYDYQLDSKKVSKNGNSWYNMAVSLCNQTTPEERAFAYELFKSLKTMSYDVDYEDVATLDNGVPDIDEQTASEI